jgi:ketosteroid isomerase-like protein
MLAVAVKEERTMSDQATLTKLNQQYVDSFMAADVEWYRRHLADDFVCIESNGSVLDKAQFLTQTAKGPGVRSYVLDDARVRMFGDVALIHGFGTFVRMDGTSGQSRYTDVYAKHDGEWKTISAQITHA